MATQLSRPRADASVGRVPKRNATVRASVVARTSAAGTVVRVPDASDDGSRRSSVLGVGATAFLVVVASLMLLATGNLATLLVDVSARDPLTYVGAIVLLAGTAVVSALIPARRAAGVDPKTALGE